MNFWPVFIFYHFQIFTPVKSIPVIFQHKITLETLDSYLFLCLLYSALSLSFSLGLFTSNLSVFIYLSTPFLFPSILFSISFPLSVFLLCPFLFFLLFLFLQILRNMVEKEEEDRPHLLFRPFLFLLLFHHVSFLPLF